MQRGFDRMTLIERSRRYLDLGPEAEILDTQARYLHTSASGFADDRDYSLTRSSRHLQDIVDEPAPRLGADNASADNDHRWLDAYDVESYLAQCGIAIDPFSPLFSVNIVSDKEAPEQNTFSRGSNLTDSSEHLFDSPFPGHGSGIMSALDISGSNMYDIDEGTNFSGASLILTPHAIAPWQGASRISTTGYEQTVQHRITDVTSITTWASPPTQSPARREESIEVSKARVTAGTNYNAVTTLTFDVSMLIKGKMNLLL